MTLIGPRPERPAFCAEFEKRIHGWHYRTMVTPGLSGLAQVTGGYDLLPKEKVVLDLWNQRGACGFPFCFSGRAKMPKEFLTYQQQMEKLRSPGLTIEDEGACCRVLADIGYFPVVNGYQSFFRDPSTRVYREGATFGDILALYEFDVELGEIMLDALLKVKAKLVKCVNEYLLSDENIGEERLLEAMGFPAEWKKITRYKIWDRPA